MTDRTKSTVVGSGASPSLVSAAPMSRIQTYSTTPIRAAPLPATPTASVGGSSTSPSLPSPMAKPSPSVAPGPAPSASNPSRNKDDRKSITRSQSSIASPSAAITPNSAAPSSLHMSTMSMGSPQVAAPTHSAPAAGLILTAGAHPLSALETELISQRSIGDDITADADGLKTLMRRDHWAGTLKLSEKCIAEARSPHELLQYRLCRLVALLKLRQYRLLKEEIDALGDLESSPTYTYENYPTYYPNKKGSFVPFTLRLLSAWVPGLLSQSTACLDALYALLNRCKSELQNVTASKAIRSGNSNSSNRTTSSSIVTSQDIPVVSLTPSPTPHATSSVPTASGSSGEKSAQNTPPVLSSPVPSLHASSVTEDLETVLSGAAGSPVVTPSTPLASMLDLGNSVFGMPSSPAANTVSPSATPASDVIEEQLRLWRGRESRVTLCIATRLMLDKEYPTAIQVLEELVSRNPTDANLLSALGRVYLHMGSAPLAVEMFKKVDTLISPKELPNSILSNMNKGLLALATDQYATAIQSFDAVLRVDSNNIAAVNNRAITLLYTCNLSKAIESLEEYIHRSPESNLNETLVFNLCTLYELSTDRAADKKRELWKLILRHASDSFDPSLLKLT